MPSGCQLRRLGTHQYSAVISGGNVELQLFHLARDGETGAFKVENLAQLQSYGGNLDDYLAAGHPFLTIAPTASAGFTGNILNTTDAQMPINSANTMALGNLRYDAAATGLVSSWSNAAAIGHGTIPPTGVTVFRDPRNGR